MDATLAKSEGWTTMEVDSFSSVIGLLWIGPDRNDLIVGFQSEPSHANRHMGTVHGGVMMTFADVALGYGVANALGTSRPSIATIHLQMHFVASPKIGEFITCRPEVVRRTSGMVFVRGLLVAGERTVANADGIWKIFEPK